MNFLLRFFGEKNASLSPTESELLEAHVCPNCWGLQEFDGKVKDFVKDQTKANINHDKSAQKAFVQQFVETYMTGIQLKKEGDVLHCPTCKTKYKNVSSKTN